MPLVDVTEPYARPPRLPAVRPAGAWSGELEPDRGWAELVGVLVDGAAPDGATLGEALGGAALDLAGCDRLSIADSVVEGITLPSGPAPAIEVRNGRLSSCDLSGARLAAVRGTMIEGCKLGGTDLSGAAITDVVFERCTLRYTDLRMARMQRVTFLDCTLDEVDLSGVEASDVVVDRSSLWAVNIDRLRATRVDLRGATELGLSAIGRLDGCLVADHQLPALAPSLALAVGLDLERPQPLDRDGRDGAP